MPTLRPRRHIVDLRNSTPSTPSPERLAAPRASDPSGPRQTRRAVSGASSSAPPLQRPGSAGPTAAEGAPREFAGLGLLPELERAVAAAGYTHATPIQAQAIPPLLLGRDLLGIAQTGTGKTAAFALPLLQRLARESRPRRTKRTRALILTPTRELAIQIEESLTTYGRGLGLRHTVIFGGVPQGAQVRTMAGGVDILVATPGRLLDLIAQGHVALDAVEVFILDEADRMLDMGFINDVKRIITGVPRERQTLLFSATMPGPIAALSQSLMRDPVRVEVTPAATTVERIVQAVMFVDKADKNTLLADLFADPELSRTLVFTRTKHGADRVCAFLEKIGVPSAAFHGNKLQGARQRALAAFTEGRVRALVATDIAARGIDIDDLTHVINFDLPNEPESYVHRIGRTARAGKEGVALSFCGRDELDYLRSIEKLIRGALPVLVDQPVHDERIASDYRAGVRGSVKQGGGGGGRGRGGGGGGGGGGRAGGGGGGSRSGGGGGGGRSTGGSGRRGGRR